METMDKNHVEGETAKNTDRYVVDRNKFFKFYKEHQDDPATLGLLDNIMNHFVVLQTMDEALVEEQRNKATYSVQQRYWWRDINARVREDVDYACLEEGGATFLN